MKKTKKELAAELESLRRHAAELEARLAEKPSEPGDPSGKNHDNNFKSLVENSPDIIARLDENQKHIYVNPKFCEVIGLPVEKVLGKTHEQIGVSKHIADLCSYAHRLAFATGREQMIEFSIPREDGEIYLQSRIVPEIGPDARVVSTLSFIRDITERVLAEKELRFDEARFETLYSLSQMLNEPEQDIKRYALEKGVSMTKSQYGYVFFVSEDEQVLSIQAFSSKVKQDCGVTDRPVEYRVEKSGLWGEAGRRREPVIVNDYDAPNPGKKGCPPGHVKIERHMGVPVIDGDKLVLIAGVANKKDEYDESDARLLSLIMASMWRLIQRKKAQEELEQAYDRLEHRVQERTAELTRTNKELGEINKRLIREMEERVRAEAALMDSEAKLDGIVTSITDHMSMLDADFNIVWANQVAKNMFGDDIEGRKCYEMICKNDKPCDECVVKKTFEDGSSHEHESIVYTKDGQKRFLWCTANAAAWDEDGRPNLVVEICRDITERKAAEEELKESQKRYKTLFDSAGDAIFVHDMYGRFLDVNEAACERYGYTKEEFLQKTPMDLDDPSDLEVVAERLNELMEKGLIQFDTQHKTKDGGVLQLESTVRLIDYMGQPAALAIGRDISERKQAEEELKNALLKLRVIFDTIPGLIVVVDKDYNIMDMSDGFSRLLDLPHPQSSVGRKCYQVIKNCDEICEECSIRDVLKSGRLETRVTTAEEERLFGRSFKIYAAPIKDEQGRILGFVECIMDISDLRELEKRLVKAAEVAEAASRAKSEFLANMSHELRTPLNAILGFTELTLSTDLTPEQQENLEMVYESGRNFLRLLNDILDFSKIEAGKLDLEEREFDFRKNLLSAVQMFEVEAEKKGLSLEYEIDPQVPEKLEGDAGRLRQVLVNLLGNAVKFTELGKVIVTVGPADAADARDRDNGWISLVFAIRDTGCGIPEDKAESIFQGFTQVDQSSTRRYAGTGLGLAISRRLVEMLGGDIWVESEPGKGSSFYFTVRLKKHVEKPGAEPAPSEEIPEIPPLNVLIAEDDRVNVLFARRALEKQGHTVRSVRTGREALEFLSRENYDCVLMDIQMPDMDGIEATRRIRSGLTPGIDPEVPVIALTAHAMIGDRERFLSAGMDDYLPKPVNMDELKRIIARVMIKRGEAAK